MAEWSKALDLGSSLFGGTSSNLVEINCFVCTLGALRCFVQTHRITSSELLIPLFGLLAANYAALGHASQP